MIQYNSTKYHKNLNILKFENNELTEQFCNHILIIKSIQILGNLWMYVKKSSN